MTILHQGLAEEYLSLALTREVTAIPDTHARTYLRMYTHTADKVASNVVVVCRLHYINTLKQELYGTKAFEETSIDEKSVVYSH